MTQKTVAAIKRLYDGLETKTLAPLPDFFTPDVQFHVIRPMPPKTYGSRDEMFRYLAEVAAVAPQDADIKLEQVAGDGDFVFAIHVEAEGTPREHRHVMIHRFDGELVREAWELTLGGEPDKGGLRGVDPALRA